MGPWSWPQVPAARSPLDYPNEGGNRLWTPSAPLPLRTSSILLLPCARAHLPCDPEEKWLFPTPNDPPLAALAPWPRSSTGTPRSPFPALRVSRLRFSQAPVSPADRPTAPWPVSSSSPTVSPPPVSNFGKRREYPAVLIPPYPLLHRASQTAEAIGAPSSAA